MEGEGLEAVDVEGVVPKAKGETGLCSSFRGGEEESFCVRGLRIGGRAGAELSEVEAGLATSGEASSGFAIRRPPREPDRSRSPVMVGWPHPNG